jgi:hypothetical protein
LLVGAGGRERADAHIERSCDLIMSLPLGAGDFVFLLDEREIQQPGRGTDGQVPLELDEWTAQQTALKSRLAELKARSVKVLPYTMEKQWT